MLDHLGITVSNYEAAKTFYEKIFKPLGYKLIMEVQGFAGFDPDNSGGALANFWMHQDEKPTTSLHIGFRAENREAVDAFYAAAIAAGGKCNGKPGVREMYHPNYYGAFVLDLDGNNIEAVCHQ